MISRVLPSFFLSARVGCERRRPTSGGGGDGGDGGGRAAADAARSADAGGVFSGNPRRFVRRRLGPRRRQPKRTHQGPQR